MMSKMDKNELLNQLQKHSRIMELHFKDMCEFEFTVQEGELYILNCRIGKRRGTAAIRIASDLYLEGIIDASIMLERIEPENIHDELSPIIKVGTEVQKISEGLAVSSGADFGYVALSRNAASEILKANMPIVYFREEVSPDDIDTILRASAVITTTGGMTSHAAVVCRQMLKPCVVGLNAKISYTLGAIVTKTHKIFERDCVTVDGTNGILYKGKAKFRDIDWRTNWRLRFIKAVIDVLLTNKTIPDDRIGTSWYIRDMLVHRIPLKEVPRSLGKIKEWPKIENCNDSYLAFKKLSKKERRYLISEIMNYKKIKNNSDLTHIWKGLRLCLFRLLSKHVGISRHYKFYRPIFDPKQTVYTKAELNHPWIDDNSRVQIIGEEYFSINYFVPEYIDIYNIRIYAAVICHNTQDLWIIDQTNPKGEKLLVGSQLLVALKIMVNNSIVNQIDIPSFYNYFRRKEYFWSWYNKNRISRQQIIEYLCNLHKNGVKNNRLHRLCLEAKLVSKQSELTKLGMSFIRETEIEHRLYDDKFSIGE